MKILLDFKNTIIGISIVVILLSVFTLSDFVFNWLFPGTNYGLISGLVASSIVLIGCTMDYYHKVNQIKEKAYIEQLGTKHTVMPTTKDLEDIDIKNRIDYPENLHEVANPILNVEPIIKEKLKIVAG